MVSNNINPKYQYPNMQSVSPSFNAMPPQIAPNMTGQLADTSLGKTLDKSQKDKYLTLGLTVPAYFGLSALNKWTKKASACEYEKSLISKIAKFGDNIAQKSWAQTIGKGFTKLGNSWNKLVDKSKVLSAMVKTPSIPESACARDQAKGAVDEIFGKIFDKIAPGGKSVAERKARLNVFHSLGLENKDYKLIKADPAKYYSRIEELCLKSGKTEVIADLNRFRAMTQSSKLGNFLAKASNRTLHGLTFGGGFFMLFSAHAIAEACTRAKNAEKGDKFSTFMEAFLGNISWIVTLPLGIKLMNAVAGLKNIGKNPKQVADVAKALAKMNEMATRGTRAEYNAAKAAWKLAKKAGNANFFQKILKIPGEILTFGRGVPKPYLPKATTFGGKVGNFFKKVPYWLRNKPLAIIIGVGTYMKIFSPIVDKLFRKASYAIFGKPKHSMYDEEKPEEPKPQDIAQNPVQNPTQIATQPIEHTSPSNLINMYNNGQKYNGNSTQTTTNTQNDKNEIEEPVRTYIPSPQAAPIQAADTSAIDAAIKRSESAEQKALEVLAMKF